MRNASRLAAFTAGLAVVLAGAFGVGRMVGPDPGQLDAEHQTESSHDGQRPAMSPRGLQVSDRGYSLQLPDPTLPPGPWTLKATIVGYDGRPVTAYRRTGDGQLHVILVRRDLSGFRHVHPVVNRSGMWSAPIDLSPGTYRMLANFQPIQLAEELTLGTDLIVPGSFRPGLLPEPSRTDYVDDYEVSLDGGLAPGALSELRFTVRRAGKTLTDLKSSLGWYDDLVALRSGDLAYLDIRQQARSSNGALTFDVATPSPGTYRLYFTFRDGTVKRTAQFTVVVFPGVSTPTPSGSSEGHS